MSPYATHKPGKSPARPHNPTSSQNIPSIGGRTSLNPTPFPGNSKNTTAPPHKICIPAPKVYNWDLTDIPANFPLPPASQTPRPVSSALSWLPFHASSPWTLTLRLHRYILTFLQQSTPPPPIPPLFGFAVTSAFDNPRDTPCPP